MVSRRKAKKAEQMQLKAQGMTLEEARKIIYQAMDGASIKASDYQKALSLIEADDAGFADEIKDFIAKKAKEDQLREAYQIVGGYAPRVNEIKEVAQKRFDRAMKLVEADDPEFAAAIRELGCVRFAEAQNEDLTQAEQSVQKEKEKIEQFAKNLCSAFSTLGDIFSDSQVQEALRNTPVVTDSGALVPMDEIEHIVSATAVNDVIADEAGQKLKSTDEPEKRQNWTRKLKNAFMRTLGHRRAQASDGSIQGIKNAFNFKKKISVSAASVAQAFRNSYNRATQSISSFARRGYKAAAAWLNRTKEKCAMPAIKAATFSLFLTSFGCDTARNTSYTVLPSQPTARNTILTNLNGTSAGIVSDLPADSTTVDAPQMVFSRDRARIVTDTTYVAPTTADNATADSVTTTVKKMDFSTAKVITDTIYTNASATEFASPTTVIEQAAATDNVQVVTDSDSIQAGTPAAGNVAERGGYENSGLISKLQASNLRNWYVDKYGENAYEDVLGKISDDMLVKGGAFEGLSPQQALRVAEAIMVHKHRFPQSAEALEAFLNPCKEAQLTAEQAEQIRKDGYNITEEGLVTDGVYNKNVYARFYQTGDCEEDGHVVYETTNNTGHTVASNRYYGRLYLRPQAQSVRQEPMDFSSAKILNDTVYHVTDSLVAPNLTLMRGSGGPEGLQGDSIGTVAIENVIGLTPTSDKKVLVEKTDNATVATSSTAETADKVSSSNETVHSTYTEGQTPLTNKKLLKKHMDETHRETLALLGLNSLNK